MDNQLLQVVHYFRPPDKYFWRWAENGQVIEWHNGETICYREELLRILQQLAPTGLPPLGSILLLMAVFKQDGPLSPEKIGILQTVSQVIREKERNDAVYGNLQPMLLLAYQYLGMVNELPNALKTGDDRARTIFTIFKDRTDKVAPATAQRILNEFNSGRLDTHIFKQGWQTAGESFLKDFGQLNIALSGFPTAFALETTIKTGVYNLPAPPEELLVIPPTDDEDLIEALRNDPQTEHIALLTSHLIAALNIPMHTSGSSDQAFGGVSDISNRGNFDRLLLSELAHDDLSLLARLANNEALYLRREELPDNKNRQRYLLIDTTLKMWGVPRIMAISAALACALDRSAHMNIEGFTLGGNSYAPADLSTREGIIDVLQQQDTALHSNKALMKFMHSNDWQENDECFLVTDRAHAQSPEFQQLTNSLAGSLHFLITVSRDGQLQFFQFVNGRRKLLSEAKLDVPAILAGKRKVRAPKRTSNTLPAFFYADPCPLLFPSSKLKFTEDHLFDAKAFGVLGITLDHRVLYWREKQAGAEELLDNIEEGRYCFGLTDKRAAVLLVIPKQENKPVLYQFFFEDEDTVVKRIPINNLPDKPFQTTHYNDNAFHITMSMDQEGYFIGALSGTVGRGAKQLSDRDLPLFVVNDLRKFVNNGYSVLNNIKEVYVNQDNALSVDNRQIRLVNYDVMKLLYNSGGAVVPSVRPVNTEPEIIHPFPGCHYKLSRFVWKDGSEVFVDSRGLLHLRSSDSNIPEITVTLVFERGIACWASDGAVCGTYYFTRKKMPELMNVTGFYKNYIQRFINRLQ